MRMDVIPIWALFVGTIAVVMCAIEAGYLLGRFVHRRLKDEKEMSASPIAGAILGLVAFMLAFTFGSVHNRFDARKGLVRDEANAIRTAWLRSDLLPDPLRAEAKGLVHDYLKVRLDFALARDLRPEALARVTSETQRIHGRLWEIAVANANANMGSEIPSLFIEPLNELASINASRVAIGLQARLPMAIWYVLFCITFLGMMGMGYQAGVAKSKRSLAQPILAVAFALVIILIASLDRPASDIISVSQQPLIDLLASMEAVPGADM